jgi:flavin-dependent dehydrogenase
MAVAKGCSWLNGDVAAGVTVGASGYALPVTSGGQMRVIKAKFVVDATGRAGGLARRLGARRIIDDRLIAASVQLDHRLPAHRDPYLHLTATPHGWWYRSDGPTGDTRVALVADPRHPTGRRGVLGLALRQIVEVLRPEQVDDPAASRIHLMDASSARLDRCAADGWLAVGDAATAFDPLCGQGLAQAFGSALAAAHAIREFVTGSRDALQAYDHAMQATYRHSRAQLNLRYAYRAHVEPSPFWRARAHTSAALVESN